jgi:hypothetical protein
MDTESVIIHNTDQFPKLLRKIPERYFGSAFIIRIPAVIIDIADSRQAIWGIDSRAV